MTNHNSTKKAVRKTKTKTLQNKMRVSEIRTFVKKVESAVLSQDINSANEYLKIAQSKLMRGVSKGVMKLNTASRKISRLTHKIKNLAN